MVRCSAVHLVKKRMPAPTLLPKPYGAPLEKIQVCASLHLSSARKSRFAFFRLKHHGQGGILGDLITHARQGGDACGTLSIC